MMFDGLSETGFAASICAAKDVLSLPCCQSQASVVNTKDGNKGKGNKAKSTLKIKFTEEEDMKLHRLVMQFGAKDWIKISQLMETRNPRQCRERWNNYVNPALRTDPWTPEEDMLLDQKFAEYGPKWNKISKFFVNRSDNNIRNRWMMIARHRAKSQKSPISPAPTPTQSPPPAAPRQTVEKKPQTVVLPQTVQPFEVPQVLMPVVKENLMDEKRPLENPFELLGEEQEMGFNMLDNELSFGSLDIWNDLSYF